MKNVLVISGLALVFAAQTSFANTRAAGEAEAVIKRTDEVVNGARVRAPRGGRAEANGQGTTAVRGAQQMEATAVEQAAADVEATVDANNAAGATCALANLEHVSLQQQSDLNAAAELGVTTSANCFGGGKIEDVDAIDNGVNTIKAGAAQAKIEGATKATKVRTFGQNIAKFVRVKLAMFTAFLQETGRQNNAESKQEFNQLCSKCLGGAPEVCSASI